jgi:hypothetical protein
VVTVSGNVSLGAGDSRGSIDMTNGGTLICQGFLTNRHDNIFIPGSGTIRLTSTGELPSLFNTFYNLIISGGTITLSKDITVNGILTFSNGQIILGNKDLSIGSSGSISGADNSNYIVTNGRGHLEQTIKNDNTYVLYPIGPTVGSYNPLIIKLNNFSTTDIFEVSVSNDISHSPICRIR